MLELPFLFYPSRFHSQKPAQSFLAMCHALQNVSDHFTSKCSRRWVSSLPHSGARLINTPVYSAIGAVIWLLSHAPTLPSFFLKLRPRCNYTQKHLYLTAPRQSSLLWEQFLVNPPYFVLAAASEPQRLFFSPMLLQYETLIHVSDGWRTYIHYWHWLLEHLLKLINILMQSSTNLLLWI